MKLFLHSCCGPCYLGVNEALPTNAEVLLCYYNPNIHPLDEEARRWEGLLAAAAATGRPARRYPYEPLLHEEAVAPSGGVFGCRCLACYRLRLDYAARHAREEGFDTLSTTLLVSPWQQHEDIIAIGREAAAAHGLTFLDRDFRPFYRAGQERAKALGLYRQKYCGCSASKDEAETQRREREEAKAARIAPDGQGR